MGGYSLHKAAVLILMEKRDTGSTLQSVPHQTDVVRRVVAMTPNAHIRLLSGPSLRLSSLLTVILQESYGCDS